MLLACIVVFGVFLAGCGRGSAMIRAKAADDRISIVCTTFPQYDWTKNIIATISSCDMLVYVGGESDSWVGDVLRDDDGADFISVNMMDMLDGMLYEEEHGDETHHGDKHNDGEHDIVEYDEHVWLSLRNAERIVRVLCNEIAVLDADALICLIRNIKLWPKKLRQTRWCSRTGFRSGTWRRIMA